jgi:hypothetical protein
MEAPMHRAALPASAKQVTVRPNTASTCKRYAFLGKDAIDLRLTLRTEPKLLCGSAGRASRAAVATQIFAKVSLHRVYGGTLAKVGVCTRRYEVAR